MGGGAEGMDSVSSFSGLVAWDWPGVELAEEGEDGGVRASSSQESGGRAGVEVGCKERDFRLGGRSAGEEVC